MNRVYRVTHPIMLETVRAVIPMMPYPPSVAAKKLTKGGGSSTEEIVSNGDYGREVV